MFVGHVCTCFALTGSVGPPEELKKVALLKKRQTFSPLWFEIFVFFLSSVNCYLNVVQMTSHSQ